MNHESYSMHGQIVGEAKVECLVTILGYNWQLAALRQNLKYADIDLCVNWGQSYGLYKMFNKIWRMKAAIQLLLNFMYITLESRFAKLSWREVSVGKYGNYYDVLSSLLLCCLCLGSQNPMIAKHWTWQVASLLTHVLSLITPSLAHTAQIIQRRQREIMRNCFFVPPK